MGCKLQSPKGGEGRGGEAEGRRGLEVICVQAPRSLLTPWLPAPPQEPQGFDNKAFLAKDGEASWAPAPSPRPTRTPAEVPPASPLPTLPAPASPGPALESPTVARDEGGPAGVRSILTKERRPEGGYKAVWFSENIGAEADVVVLNAPTMDADRASDSGSEGSGDESNGAAGVGEGPGSDSTSI